MTANYEAYCRTVACCHSFCGGLRSSLTLFRWHQTFHFEGRHIFIKLWAFYTLTFEKMKSSTPHYFGVFVSDFACKFIKLGSWLALIIASSISELLFSCKLLTQFIEPSQASKLIWLLFYYETNNFLTSIAISSPTKLARAEEDARKLYFFDFSSPLFFEGKYFNNVKYERVKIKWGILLPMERGW